LFVEWYFALASHPLRTEHGSGAPFSGVADAPRTWRVTAAVEEPNPAHMNAVDPGNRATVCGKHHRVIERASYL
jgi:hypothetical protein